MAKKYRDKVREYDAYQLKQNDPSPPDWFTAAVSAGKLTVHDDHVMQNVNSLGGGPIRLEFDDWILVTGDDIYSSKAEVFPKFFEEKP